MLLNDTAADHIAGCNSAFRREALLAVGGWDPFFRIAGDDVDVVWRLQAGPRHPSTSLLKAHLMASHRHKHAYITQNSELEEHCRFLFGRRFPSPPPTHTPTQPPFTYPSPQPSQSPPDLSLRAVHRMPAGPSASMAVPWCGTAAGPRLLGELWAPSRLGAVSDQVPLGTVYHCILQAPLADTTGPAISTPAVCCFALMLGEQESCCPTAPP